MKKYSVHILVCFVAILLLIAVLAWSSGTPSSAPTDGPTGIADTTSGLVTLESGDTYDLVARPVQKEIGGKTQNMLAYNGQIPGPVLKVKQGSEITIRFKNEMDWETSLHSHGVRVDNAMDGAAPFTQPHVPPGESFTYTLRFPDAGAYWYHPHSREDATQELGLYGMFIVEPQDITYWNPVHREMPLVLDDVLVDANGLIAPFSNTTVSHALMGRFGNTMLVNGRTDFAMSAKQDEVIRFYVLNAANTRPFKLAFDGAKMKLVGSDGGRAAHDEWVEDVLIGPSERAVVEVKFDRPGQVQIEHRTPLRTYALGRVRVLADDSVSALPISYEVLGEAPYTMFPNLADWYDREPDKRLRLDVDLGMMGQSSGMAGHGGMMGGPMGHEMAGEPPEDGIEWEQPADLMNAMSTPRTVKWKFVEDATGRENMDIDWTFKKGEYVKMRLVNDPDSDHPMQHPIHLHGQRFMILARDGKRDDNPVWKDTVFVKAGETVDILVEASNPGEWLMHCHIPEHMESGMMGEFKVIES
ncbi:multicopper oxidase family protein [Candidatus Uhrbacteria bacterium]|nr:MAG: multicopper oxidase family protein [Candidatus Uhrbacteria bacterium]